jgi:hypothetical protein
MATRVLYIINHIGQRWHCNLVWMDNLILKKKRGVWGLKICLEKDQEWQLTITITVEDTASSQKFDTAPQEESTTFVEDGMYLYYTCCQISTRNCLVKSYYGLPTIGQRWHCNLVWMDNLILKKKRGVWGLKICLEKDQDWQLTITITVKNWSPRSLQSQESLNRPVFVQDSLNRVLTILNITEYSEHYWTCAEQILNITEYSEQSLNRLWTFYI